MVNLPPRWMFWRINYTFVLNSNSSQFIMEHYSYNFKMDFNNDLNLKIITLNKSLNFNINFLMANYQINKKN